MPAKTEKKSVKKTKTKRVRKAESKTTKKLKKAIDREKLLVESGLAPKPLPKTIYNKIKEGRPTEYTEKFCIDVIEKMAQGKSKTAAHIEMGISSPTFYDWITEYKEVDDPNNPGQKISQPNPRFQPDFYRAVKIGEELNLRWWEEIGRMNLHNKNFNNTMYMMQMQNRHGWSRRIDGKIDINETVTQRKEIVFKFETEEIKAYARELAELGIIQAPAQTH